ncbi:MAG: hypothetical protein HWE14_08500 [Flavobacteriia bacterium]|nr:hypothetical protein [Flavobacteriia bacterium]
MRRLSWYIAVCLGLFSASLTAQNPHGEGFAISCNQCHNTEGWNVTLSEVAFDHNEETDFPLEGTHASVTCVDCHTDLAFENTPSQCVDCHTDVHQQTVGNDCVRCHTSEDWLVNEIPEIHEMNGFPLEGSHALTSCVDCHQSANTLAFHPQGNQCVDCHREDYFAAVNPNHVQSGFSLDCAECHSPISQEWAGEDSHFFFPLVQSHDGLDCTECHTPGQPFSAASSECVSCHLDDYQNTSMPNHVAAGISTDCALCHDLSPGWPAEYRDHDNQYFPIYSGRHQGEWFSCVECHNNPGNFALFSCIDCHEHNRPDMDDEHDDVGGYQYNSQACFNCHPNGDAD